MPLRDFIAFPPERVLIGRRLWERVRPDQQVLQSWMFASVLAYVVPLTAVEQARS